MILERLKLSETIGSLKKQGKIIVFTNGCFDIIHAGHVTYLEKARSYGDFLVVGLNSDASVKRLKGSTRPIIPENDRALILSSLRFVDYVSIFDEDTPYELIKLLMPDILVKGGDYKIENIIGGDIVQKNGGKVITVPLLKGKSSTFIIENLNSQ